MKVTINPPKTPVTKGSLGVASATIPNVCKMPAPPAPFVPVPLPNIGKSGMAPKGYSKKVTIEGKNVAIKGATFKSMGDMASKGTGGGLISANTHGPTKFVGPGSLDVKIEGKNVHLLGDPMLNNCGGSGSPPNSATLLGVIQGPLMVVVEGKTKCIVCEDESGHDDLKETNATKDEAEALEGKLLGAGFAANEVQMLGIAHCQCATPKKAAARSTMRKTPRFAEVATGYWTPEGEYSDWDPEKVLDMIRRLAANRRASDAAISRANKRRVDFKSRNRGGSKGKLPQVNIPGSCAAPKALIVLLEKKHLPRAITERFCGSGKMASPVEYYNETSGTRELVQDRVFEHGDSVPPCGACDALLPVLLCPPEDATCPE